MTTVSFPNHDAFAAGRERTAVVGLGKELWSKVEAEKAGFSYWWL